MEAEPDGAMPMTALAVLLLLAGGFALVLGAALMAYRAWAPAPPEGTRLKPQRATPRRGERTMTGVGAGPDRERVTRWLTDGPIVLERVRAMFQECDAYKAAAEAAQAECGRLRQECEQLGAEVRRLTAETERVRSEWAETAHWLTAKLTEAADRLRSAPASAAGAGSQEPPRRGGIPPGRSTPQSASRSSWNSQDSAQRTRT